MANVASAQLSFPDARSFNQKISVYWYHHQVEVIVVLMAGSVIVVGFYAANMIAAATCVAALAFAGIGAFGLLFYLGMQMDREIKSNLEAWCRENPARNLPAQRIWCCYTEHRVGLDLSSFELTTLPPSVSWLRQLILLNISNNLFKQVPAHLARLPKQCTIDAAQNRLSLAAIQTFEAKIAWQTKKYPYSKGVHFQSTIDVANETEVPSDLDAHWEAERREEEELFFQHLDQHRQNMAAAYGHLQQQLDWLREQVAMLREQANRQLPTSRSHSRPPS